MKKIILSLTLASSLIIAADTNDSLDVWRDGFITAYKALKVDTSTQGTTSKAINTEDYIIYFDASTQDISDWDKLMVQMFGYSSSINKPIRTVENFIIFDSYNNKATALQEMENLNSKIFKNSEKYKLKIFDNTIIKRKFYNDRALLINELKDLEALLKKVNEIKLIQKEKELEDNQKVALVYVDNNTNKVLPNQSYKLETQLEPLNKVSSKSTPEQKTINTENKIFYAQAIKNAIVFSKPAYDSKYKLYNVDTGKVLEFEQKNEYGWYKLKDKNEYVAGYLFRETTKKKYEKEFSSLSPVNTNNGSASGTTLIDTSKIVSKNHKKESPKIDLINKIVTNTTSDNKDKFFTLIEKEAIIYKLDNFSGETTNYPVSSFVPVKTLQNNYEKISYTDIVKDTDGNQYVKLKNNTFVDLKAVYIIK